MAAGTATEVKVEMVKCACPDCVCVVNVSGGIQRNGHIYCSEACADHHANGLTGPECNCEAIAPSRRRRRLLQCGVVAGPAGVGGA